jgi:outer membrane protein OmpA-like peptidoglycan-associated protein
VLRAVVAALKATPGIKKVSIQGHTDNKGVAEKNLDLSQRRAESVHRWLAENGVEGERLEAKGFGDTKPIASNSNVLGRARNRRVEFVIVDPSPESGQIP